MIESSSQNYSQSLENKQQINPQSQNNEIEDQKNQQISQFSSQEIQIIRSHIANLNINEQQTKNSLQSIVKSIQQEQHFQNRSSKQIISIINRILSIQKSDPKVGGKQQNQRNQNQFKIQTNMNNKSEKQQNPFKPKVLFRLFLQDNDKVQEPNQLFNNTFAENINISTGIRIQEIISTKNTNQLNKKPSSGFMAVSDRTIRTQYDNNKNNNEKTQKYMQFQNKSLNLTQNQKSGNFMQIQASNNNSIQFPSFLKKPKIQSRQINQMIDFKQKNKIKTPVRNQSSKSQRLDKFFQFQNKSSFSQDQRNGGFNQIQQSNNNGFDLPTFVKKTTKQFRQTPQTPGLKIKRKIRPTNPLLIDPDCTAQQKIQWIQSTTNDCHNIVQKKLQKKSLTTNKESYYLNQRYAGIYNQYFYSNYDKIYFNQQNNFAKLLDHLGVDAKNLKYKDLKLIKKALPSTKIFDIQFIINEQNKLNQFRSQLRQLPKQRARNQDIQLVVGRQVTALHPICGHLHSGTILAIYKQNQYMVKFLRPQLGTQKILDINISTRSMSTTNKATIQNIDYQSMVTVIKLLQYKGQLMQKFKQYNNLIQELKISNKQPDNSLLQQYGWVGSTINILSMGLRHIIAKFRMRGLNQINQQTVGKNFSSLLINPLNLMSKQLQNSSQISDIHTSNQIKRMMSNRSMNRIDEFVLKLQQKNDHLLEQSEMNPQQKQSMSMLLKNFLSMLVNLRYDGRNFNLDSNKYLNNILSLIDGQYSQYFNPIYSNIHSLVKKIAENQ